MAWNCFACNFRERVPRSNKSAGQNCCATLRRTDSPQNTRCRRIVDATFNMRQVRNVEQRVVEVVHQLIDRFIDRGKCEIVDEFSLPLPPSSKQDGRWLIDQRSHQRQWEYVLDAVD